MRFWKILAKFNSLIRLILTTATAINNGFSIDFFIIIFKSLLMRFIVARDHHLPKLTLIVNEFETKTVVVLCQKCILTSRMPYFGKSGMN